MEVEITHDKSFKGETEAYLGSHQTSIMELTAKNLKRVLAINRSSLKKFRYSCLIGSYIPLWKIKLKTKPD